jgi:hypothetical protein
VYAEQERKRYAVTALRIYKTAGTCHSLPEEQILRVLNNTGESA